MEKGKREEIAKEAKQILDKFSKALGKVDLKEKSIKQGIGGFRIEGPGVNGNKDFRERMFENAPEKNHDFIIAESKKW